MIAFIACQIIKPFEVKSILTKLLYNLKMFLLEAKVNFTT